MSSSVQRLILISFQLSHLHLSKGYKFVRLWKSYLLICYLISLLMFNWSFWFHCVCCDASMLMFAISWCHVYVVMKEILWQYLKTTPSELPLQYFMINWKCYTNSSFYELWQSGHFNVFSKQRQPFDVWMSDKWNECCSKDEI